jgi:hypothetical protein
MAHLPGLFTSSHLHLLEDHPHTVYGVWSDLTLAYMNPAWFAFARRNGAEQSVPSAWSIGRSTIDAVVNTLRFEIPHVKMDRVAMPPIEQAYTDEDPMRELSTRAILGPCRERFPSGNP